jgi:hypothetical protein
MVPLRILLMFPLTTPELSTHKAQGYIEAIPC